MKRLVAKQFNYKLADSEIAIIFKIYNPIK